ncbi:pentatricopeptide repeat-containing protein At5g18950-like [Camellia sinensis]|uniref:pentatricopeptide repeat-containing protein At5g18950-like n=1 Tax=Camellia sinensis TaxID=4442 RepID=UPI001035D543|nr:pentatricopeptide repeat-containing protein At5g18950-like [Camellia sinensis]
MIHGLCKMKWIGEAQKLWFEMVHKGIVPNEYTYNAFIYGLSRIGNLEEAKELYNEMCCKGYKETTVSCNTMIRGLCFHGRTEKTHVLFEKMAEKGIARDIITYNSLIQGFCKEGKIDESINLLAKLLEKGLQASAATYAAPIEKLCEMGDVDEAKELWEDMQKMGVEPAVCTRDFIITGLSNKGYVAKGMEWLAAMLRRNLKPQNIGYTLCGCIFRSLVDKLCEQNSDHVETCLGGILQKDTTASEQNNVLLSLRFYLWLRSQRSFVPDKLACDAIFDGLVKAKAANAAKSFLNSVDFTPQPGSLKAYVRCLCENGSIEKALKVFDELQKLGICPLLETWNSTLLGSVRSRRTDVVWKLYEEMMGSGVARDVDTVEYLIQAFCIDNNVSKGFGLLRQVLEDGFVPNNVAFNKLIFGFCKDRYYSRVSVLLHTMIAKNRRPDIFTY